MATRRKILHEGVSDLSTFGVFIDEDDMHSDSATKVPSQKSVKKYVDDNAGGGGDFLVVQVFS